MVNFTTDVGQIVDSKFLILCLYDFVKFTDKLVLEIIRFTTICHSYFES